MEAAVGQPVRLQNDAALAGLAEAVLGAGRSHKVVAYITVSTGVNGVRIVNGEIDPARYGFELGAQLVPDAEGHPVALESLVGGAALQHKYGRPPVELRHDASVWVAEARYLAIGLHNTLVHWSPDIVVYGGSMMHDIALSAIRHELAKYPAPAGLRPPLHLAELDDNRGMYGALVWLQ
jgi:predicted NBD/HSP70 family sugar kinase